MHISSCILVLSFKTARFALATLAVGFYCYYSFDSILASLPPSCDDYALRPGVLVLPLPLPRLLSHRDTHSEARAQRDRPPSLRSWTCMSDYTRNDLCGVLEGCPSTILIVEEQVHDEGTGRIEVVSRNAYFQRPC